MNLSVEELLAYTGEERARWERWFYENGEELLKMPILGERENSIGALILHIFGPEFRYVQSLQGIPTDDYRGRPSHHVEQLFGFGIESRKLMRKFVAGLTDPQWRSVVEFDIGPRHYQATVRKVILHVLLHEIRHWAQIARLMRERGFIPPGDHDLLTSQALS